MSPRALVLLLFVGLSSTTPLSYASPPDPTWIEGIYDDADGDDVIVSLSWAAWAVELDPLARLTPLFATVPFVVSGEPQLLSMAVRRAFQGRAPPEA